MVWRYGSHRRGGLLETVGTGAVQPWAPVPQAQGEGPPLGFYGGQPSPATGGSTHSQACRPRGQKRQAFGEEE